ncbi:MAG: adenine-specific DNA-methyltransferase [Planctomycetaceae bacterium]|jgi:site-specific DNA-methyltransferase (adenine-specific)|nr:adenine-specific DNA-methyltransferase [Planctomycetaceae bacterium]
MEKFDYQNHTIIQGDSLDILSYEISDHSVDLIFVDPPYNIGKNFNGHKDKWVTEDDYLNWCYKWIDLCIDKLKSNGSMYIMTSTQFMPYFDLFIRKRMTILSRLVWYYDSSGVQAKNYYGSMYEPILFCVKNPNDYTFNAQDILVEAKTGSKRKLIDYRKNPPQVYNSEKVPGNVWEFARVRYRMDEYENHPTQKPIALLERIIKASSNIGDTVLDPFSGTFTTSFVAKQLDRKSIGIELQEDYVKIGLRRLQLTDEYRGEKLQKEIRTFETKKTQIKNLQLFNLFGKQSDKTLIH